MKRLKEKRAVQRFTPLIYKTSSSTFPFLTSAAPLRKARRKAQMKKGRQRLHSAGDGPLTNLFAPELSVGSVSGQLTFPNWLEPA